MKLNDITELVSEYKNSVFELGLKPEYSVGEVTLAALYRQVGWQELKDNGYKRYGESQVNTEATRYFRSLENQSQKIGDLELDDWKRVMFKSLATPKMPNQVKTKNPILYPFVPDCALYSSAARQRGNPWNPGNLIEKVILTGADNENESKALWDKIFNALTSDPKDPEEDLFARIVSKEFELRRPDGVVWSKNEISQKVHAFDELVLEKSPSKQLFEDLKKVVELKSKLNRRQWLSMVESILRIGCACHLLWVCSLNDHTWKYLKSRYEGIPHQDLDFQDKLIHSMSQFWKLEERAVGVIKEQVQAYVRSQIAINYVLKKLKNEGAKFSLDSIASIEKLGDLVKSKSDENEWSDLIFDINDAYDMNPGLLACKKGFTKSIFEFIRHSLGQKQTAELHKSNFDQSYWLKKKANYSSAPWIVDLGPTSVLTMVYCCSYGFDQNRTISDFLKHLSRYGFIVDEKDLINSNLMSLLTTLQVVRDSPDAEGGMVIINPFN